eukprot:1960816-Pyramimonas_sp.AAC.1
MGGPVYNRTSPRPSFSGLSLADSRGSAAAMAHPSNVRLMLAAAFLSHFRSRVPELCSPLVRGFPIGLPQGSLRDPRPPK